jgi:hypothetical protein
MLCLEFFLVYFTTLYQSQTLHTTGGKIKGQVLIMSWGNMMLRGSAVTYLYVIILNPLFYQNDLTNVTMVKSEERIPNN